MHSAARMCELLSKSWINKIFDQYKRMNEQNLTEETQIMPSTIHTRIILSFWKLSERFKKHLASGL